jgi:hypothetical protein
MQKPDFVDVPAFSTGFSSLFPIEPLVLSPSTRIASRVDGGYAFDPTPRIVASASTGQVGHPLHDEAGRGILVQPIVQ